MSQGQPDNSFKFFGAALDVMDNEESIDIKRAYLESIASGKKDQIGRKDPYALFCDIAGETVKSFGHRSLGRFMVESWLCPKPRLTDSELISAKAFGHFLRKNGLWTFAEMLKEFVEVHIFPARPAMIGVDHSLTGGILMALSRKLGPENLGVIVFDAHTDAIPLSIRSGLVEYALEKGLPAPSQVSSPGSQEYFTTGNFLLQLIEMGVLLPGNLVIAGPVDSIENYKVIEDKRVQEYVNHCEYLQGMGVSIISREQLKQDGQIDFGRVLDQIDCSDIYVSLDVDVSARCGVLATRFLELQGTPISIILKHVSEIVQSILTGRFSLVGFDVMEIDIHKVGAKLRGGLVDQTEDFIKQYITMLARSFS